MILFGEKHAFSCWEWVFIYFTSYSPGKCLIILKTFQATNKTQNKINRARSVCFVSDIGRCSHGKV